MRLLTWFGCAAFAAFAFYAASDSERCKLSVLLLDENGVPIPGLLRIETADGKPFVPSELLSRGFGLDATEAAEDAPIRRWSVLAKKAVLDVPRSPLTLRAFSGLETRQAEVTVDLTGKANHEVAIRLQHFYHPHSQGYRAGNPHLHLKKITRAEADRYLTEVPKADGLDLVFLSYLERAGADQDYVSNKYTRGDLSALSESAGVIFGNGEEHRHNFPGEKDGFGHVMLLNIKELVQPVSIGPGIMKSGTDGIPLQRGIDSARKEGATAIWCHNNWGEETIADWVSGRVDAQNIFDGGPHGSYKDSFYPYLNAGFRVPFSTGTDWFIYDFSRVYVAPRSTLGSPEAWLQGLARGRSYITNGPFLEFQINGRSLGGTVQLPSAGAVEITARGLGRVDFSKIEVIQNGKVIRSTATKPAEGHFVAESRFMIKVAGPCWFALRTPPPPEPDDPTLQAPVPLNELGRPIFSHTSAIYVDVAGRKAYDAPTAERLLAKLEQSSRYVQETGRFADEAERARVLEVYVDGITALRKHMQEMSHPADK